VFGLPAPPDPSSGPDDVPEWDSLGSLKLLLALEEAFGCTIDEDVLAGARTVGDVQRVVELTRRRAAARA
jgi:acyl carrier protein